MKAVVRVLALAVVLVGASAAVVTDAQARSVKCFSTPVPGQPGVFIGTCTTNRA